MSGSQLASNSGSALALASPVQIIKLVKPAAGRTENFYASFDGSVKIDFTAIANEQVTFFHDSKNQSLHVIFSDGSQIIIEPFFDSMGVMSNFFFEMAPGEVLDSAQFVSQFPITRDQSVLPALTEGPTESGAEFNDPSVDSLPPNIKLALLPPEELSPLVFHETIPAPLPTVAFVLPTLPTLPPPAAIEVTDSVALANEAGLPGIGSNAASNSEIFHGSITASGGTGPYTFTLNSPATGSHGTLLLNADGTYTYTLTSPFDTTPDSATTATQTEQNKDSFSYTVTDAHGNSTTGTILVDIVDDVPQANNDGPFTVAEGAPLSITTALANDLFGADGVDPATGVAVTTAATKGTVAYSNGTFTYTATAGQEGLDTFQYTITDQDGDTSTATVTVNLGTDSVPSLVGSASNLTVDEDGFATAANDTVTARIDETDSTESLTATGTAVVNFGNDVPASPLGSIVLVDTPALDNQLHTHDGQSVTFALDGSGDLVGTVSAGATEVIRIHLVSAAAGPGAGDVTYTYSTTLSQPLEHADDALENSITLTGVTVQVTDSDADTLPVSFNVTIVDDVPQANSEPALTVIETDGVTPGTNLLANDLQGADGATVTAVDFGLGGGFQAIAAVGTTTLSTVNGTYVFQADGTWSFDPNANLNNAAGISAGFTYQITDGDGDTSTAAQVITILSKILHLEKDATVADGTANSTSDVISYTLAVTNQGNAAIANVVVDDPFTTNETPVLNGAFNIGDTNQDNLLDVGETWQYTASHQVTQAELDAGTPIVNTATVTGTGATPDDDGASVPVDQNPALNIVKFVNGQDADSPTGPHVAVGSTVTYTYVVTDTGNVPLANVAVTDDKLGPITSFTGDTNNNNLLDLTETWTYTQTATALAGQQANVGTVTAQDANNPPGTTVTDDNPANYFGDAPGINIVKFVNGQDADSPTGPHVAAGSTVTYTYVVTDTGNVPLANVAVTDDKLGPITSFTGDTNNNNLLDLTETWTYTQTATALAGQQANVGTVTAQDANNPPGTTVTDDNPANYFGDAPGINIVKFVNGQDADSPTGPHVAVGSTVTYTYVVTDTGNVPLANVAVTDDKLGPITSFTGDTNNNNLLDLTETWTYTQTATALAGQQANVGTVTAQDANNPPGTTVTDDNPANYFGDAPGINIVKFVNGQDADSPTGPHVAVGSTVTYTYVVTDTGNVPLANVAVTDDKLGPITSFTGDTNNNNLLDPTETWTYTQTATALAGQQANVGTVTAQDANNPPGTTVTDDNPANYFGDAPGINIVKFVNGQDADSPTGPHVAVGSTVTYTYVVTDTGNVPLANVVVTDDKLGPITSFTGDTNNNNLLDLTETWTYTQTATALAGQQANVGTVTAQDANNPPGTTVTDDNPANYFGDAPGINIVKFVNGQDADSPTGPHVAVGSTVTYTYVVTDTGNVPLANVAVTDDKLGPITSFTGDTNNNNLLDPTETWTYTQTATALAGQQTNVGTVTGQAPNIGTTVTDGNPANYFGDAPGINIVKFVNGQDADSPTGPHVAVGSTVTYTYVVTDTGNVPLANVAVTDDKLGPITSFTGDTNNNSLLDLTETWTYTQTATALAGQQANVGTVTGQDANNPPGTTVTDGNPANYFGDAPGINIVKFVNGQDADSPTGPHVAVGSTVTYTYVVTDTGNVPLANVVVTDDKLGPITSFTGDTNNNNLLDLTETWTYTQTATALAGQQANVGTVTAQDANNPPGTTVTDGNPANYFGDAPGINIVKFVNGQDADSPTGPHVAVGSTVTYTYVVTDTGNVPLANVVVTDDKLGPITSFTGDTNNNNLLDLTETWTYTQTATALAGQQANVGTVTAQDANNPPGTTVTDDNPANYFGDAPGINIVKFVNGQDADSPTGPHVAVGSTVTYTYVVTDTGNVPLANVAVTDDKLGPITSFTGDTNNNNLLDPTETWTYTQTATALAGQQTNVGTVTAQDANNPPGTTVTDDNPANYFGDAPGINIVKFVNGQDADSPTGPHVAAGSTVTYTYVVTDTGNVPLANVAVTDDKLGTIAGPASGDTNGNGLLDPTETWTYTQTAIAVAGQQTNVGTVTGQDANIGTTVTDGNPANYFGDAPGIQIVKNLTNADDAAVGTAGETIEYTITVANTGNVDLTGVILTDTFAGGATLISGDTNNNGILETNEIWTYSADYVVTQADLNAGVPLVNVATVDTNQTDPQQDDAISAVDQDVLLTIVKSLTNVDDAVVDTAGETIEYTITVDNTGNVDLTGVVLADPFAGGATLVSGDLNNNSILETTETWIYSADYVVTQADLDAGTDLVNVATVDTNQTNLQQDDTSSTVAQSKILHIEKDATVPGGTADVAGETISYTLAVTNQGNAAIANVVVDDPFTTNEAPVLKVDGIHNVGDADNDSLLDVSETWQYTASHQVTQAELDAGTAIVNTATVTGAGATLDTDDASVPVVQSKVLHLEKDAAVADGTANSTSDVINYTLAVTNQGNAAIANVVVDDPFTTNEAPVLKVDGIHNVGDADNDSLLDVSETWQYTASQQVTQAELDSNGGGDGTIDNTATVTGTGATPDDDGASVPVVQSPSLTIVKDLTNADDAVVDTAGETIEYTITVANTGNIDLTNVVLVDVFAGSATLVSGDLNNNSILETTETWVYTADYVVTQADLNAGVTLVNVATVDTDQTNPRQDNATSTIAQSKILHLEKDATVADGTANSTSDTITYTYTVTNTGNAAIAGVVVTDDNLTPGTPGDDFSPTFSGGDTNNDNLLDVGETWTYTASHTVTQTELDAGAALVNVATATGTGATPDSDDATVPIAQSKILHLEKDATVADGTANSTSDVINYTLLVTNQGNAAIANVVVDDPFTTNEAPVLNGAFNVGDTDQDNLLDVGETWQYTASHTVTQTELDAGTNIVNTATVTGTGATPDTDGASVPIAQSKILHLEKDATVADGTANSTSDTITYTYTVTNTGNAAIAGVVVTDDNLTPGTPGDDFNPAFSGGDTDNDGLLDVGETWTYTASHTVTQIELDAGAALVNVATATGTGATPDSDDATVPIAQSKILHLEKDATVADGTANSTSDVINYTLLVTNQGNAAIANVVVDDPFTTNEAPVLNGAFNVGDTDQDNLLDVGETWQYTASHQVTQAELDAGTNIVNTATVTGTGATPDTDGASVPIAQSKILHLEKDATVADGTANSTSDTITYTYTVTNTGNAAIAGVVVTDDNLTPGTPGDDFNPAFSGGDTDNDGLLDVGETWTYTASHTVTQIELDAGAALVNVATATGTGATPDSDDATVPIAQAPALDIAKVVNDVARAAPVADAAGDVIHYTITVANTGNTTLTGVVVTDPNADAGSIVRGADVVGDNDGLLEVGETWGYTAAHTVTQAEIDSNGGGDGAIDNTATADSAQTAPDTANASVPVTQIPALNITKVVNDVDGDTTAPVADAAGDVIHYTITVANTGNQTLTGVVVTDPNADPGSLVLVADAASADGELDVGETWGYTAARTVTQAEIDSNGGGDGTIDNTATADSAQTAPDTANASVPVTRIPALIITKVVNDVDGDTTAPVADAAGDVIHYAITVANTGNTTLTGVVVTDPNADPGSLVLVADAASADGELDVGETWTYTASHQVTQAEIDSNGGGDGTIDNTATADSAQTAPDTANASVPTTQGPALNITKVVNDVDGDTTGPVADAAGDVIHYAITVANTGNTTLTGVVVTDPNADPGSLVLVADAASADGELDVGETWTYTASHQVTQAEIDSNGGGDGDIDNTATADSAQTAPDTANAAVPVEQTPALNITKDASVPGGTVDAAGEVINYTITVENTGNRTLTGVVVTDPNADPGSIALVADAASADGELDVGETWTYTATHTVTQAEIDSNGGGDGDIDNTATADSDQTGADTANASVPVTQTPPTGGDTTTLPLDEEALGPGNPNATGTNPSSTAEMAFDTLSFTAGSSPLTTFAFSTVLSGLVASTDGALGNELVWVRDSATQITAHFDSGVGPVAITLTLTPPPGGSIGDFATGDVTVTATLSDNLKHALAAGEQVLNLGSVDVIATATDGHFVSDTVGVTVKDDVPTAVSGPAMTVIETDGVTSGANLLANDVPGADGATVTAVNFGLGGGFQAIAAAGTTTLLTVNGTYTFQANGAWTFDPNANLNNASDISAGFAYQITDSDGDPSIATQAITVNDGAVAATPTPVTLDLDEAALSTAGATGSNPGLTSEVDSTPALSFTAGSDNLTSFAFSGIGGLVTDLNGTGGQDIFWQLVSPTQIKGFLDVGQSLLAVTLDLVAPASIAAGATGNVTVTATLSDNLQHVLANGAQISPIGNVGVVATDTDGDITTGTVNITVQDDVPTATSGPAMTVIETDGVTSGTNLLANDVPGADGATVTAVDFGLGGGFQAIAAAGTTTLLTVNGTYTFQANGAWTFDPNANLNNASGISAGFTYQITDSDGDPSTAAQVITVNDGAVAATPTAVTLDLDEAALSTAGATGSNPSLTSEVDNAPALSFTAGSDNLTSFAFTSIAGLVTDLNGTGGQDIFWQLVSGTQIKGFLDAGHTVLAVTLDLSAPASIAAGATGNVTVTATLSDNLQHVLANGAQISSIGSVGVIATDTDGDTTTGTVNISVTDDVPTAPTVTASAATAGVDETPGVQTTGGASDVLGSTAITFNGAATTVAGLFSTVANKGSDPDVLVASLDNGALSFASSGASSIVSVTGGAFGADGAGTTTYKLTVTNAASGLTLTDGTAITLSLDGSGRVIGTVGVDAANSGLTGKAAFAIAIDPLTGQVYVAEYLSLHHNATNTPNDLLSLAAGRVGVTVTLTDGDGDPVTSAAGDISTHINFLDDGPSNISPGPASLTNGSGSATASLDIDTNTDNNNGADGGTVIFAASLNGQDSGLTSSARKIFYQTSNGGHTLTGFADQNLNGVYDPATDTTAIFTINLNLDKSLAIANDTYTVQMFHTVDSATHIDFDSGAYNFVGGNDSWAEFISAGETVANPIDNNSPDLLLTPAVNHLPASSINTSANSAGVGGGQSVGSVGNLPETFRVDFVTDLRGNPAGSPANYGNPNNRDHVFDGHYTVDGSSADFIATSGSTINFAAFDDPDGNNIVGDGVKDTITGVVIRFGSSTSGFIDLTQPLLPSYVVGGHTFTITEIADGSINVGGVAGTTSVAIFTANGYNSLEYTWVAGDTFKIGNFGAAKQSTAPVDFSVPVQVVDGDGDIASGNLPITLTSPGADPSASVNIAADLLTQANAQSLVTIHFNEAVTGFDTTDLTLTGGTLSDFRQIDADTYTADFLVLPNFEGTGEVTLTGAYTDLAGNPGITGASDTVAINTLNSTLDATILTTGTSGVGQTVLLTFVDLQDPTHSYAGLYDLGAQGGAFQREVDFFIDPSREYAVSLEATGEIPVPIRVLTVEGVTIHVIEGVVTLKLDNDNSILLDQTALTAIIQPNDPTTHQTETPSSDGNAAANNGLVDPDIMLGSGAGSAENSVNYLYGADADDDLTGDNDTDVLNGGAGRDLPSGGDGNDVLIYDTTDQKIDGGSGTDVGRTDEAALGFLNNVGVATDAATGFSVVEVVPFKQNIKNIEVLLITDDGESSPFKGGLLNLTAQDVLDITDPNDHTLTVLGNPGDVVNLGLGASAWTKGAPDANGFQTYSETFNGINLLLHIEHTIVVT